MKRGREGALVSALLAAAVLPRLAFVLLFYKNPGNLLGVDNYVALGISLLTRGTFSLAGVPSCDAPPLFPMWIAGLFWLFGQKPLVVLLCNVFLSAATGWLFFVLARRRLGARTGLLFLALWAVYPYSIYYCGWTYRETLFGFLTAAMLDALDRWYETGSLRRAGWAGALGALLALTNPSCLLFVGAAPLGLWLVKRTPSVWRAAACFYAVVALLYSPWVIRNELAFGHPVLTNIHGAMNPYYGLTIPNDDLGTDAEARFHHTDPVDVEANRLINEGRAYEAIRLYQDSSRRLILRHPLTYVRQCLARVVKYWRLVPYPRSYPYGYAKIFWVSLLSDGLLIPLGFAGLWLWRRRWKELLPFYLLAALVPLAYYLSYAVVRFRMPVMPVVILAAVGALERLLLPAAGRDATAASAKTAPSRRR
jgi:4-amino-4-deoxy-L-arabinose transferase-like glycosyltransferase